MELHRSKRLLAGLAILYGALAVAIAFLGTGSYLLRTLIALTAATPGIASILLLIRNRPVAKIDCAGIAFHSRSTGLIAWSEITGFSINNDAEGARVICIHFRNEAEYLARLNFASRRVAAFRRSLGYTPLVIFQANLDEPMADLVHELKRYVPQISNA